MSPASPGPAVAREPRRDAALLIVALGGVHALLFLASYALLSSTPAVEATDAEIQAFYHSADRRRLVLVGLYVMPFAGIVFLWFSMALRGWLRAGARKATELVGGLYLASSLLYVALFFVGAAATSVVAVSSEYSDAPLDPLLARQFRQFGATILLVFGMRMAAMFVFTTARLARLAGVLPRWFGPPSLVVGLFLLLNTSLSRALVLVFPLWLLALCALLWRRRRARPPPEAA